MDASIINELLHRASILGAQGYEVVGLIPPQSTGDNPIPILLTKEFEHYTTSDSRSY